MARSYNWDVWTIDNLHHFLGGLGINGIIFAGIGWLIAWLLSSISILPIVTATAAGVVLVTGGGFLREYLSHRDRAPDPILTKHNIAEALWWGVGALASFAIYLGLFLGGVAFPGVG